MPPTTPSPEFHLRASRRLFGCCCAARAERSGSNARTAKLVATAAVCMLCTAFAGCRGTSNAVVSSAAAVSHTTQASAVPSNAPPAFMIGDFGDDYGGSFTISATDFVQLPRGRFHIVQWNVAGAILHCAERLTQSRRSQPVDAHRLDALSGMEPYNWAFCFSAYKALTREEAQHTPAAKRETPRTGCNNFPFTRMKRRP